MSDAGDRDVCQRQVLVEVGHTQNVGVDLTLGHIPTPEPVTGVKATATVTSTGPVYKGEFVHRELEYIAKGEALRWVMDGVKILAAAELSEGRVGVVFTQNGKTKFKTIAIENDAVALGNTLTLLDDEELEEAVLVELASGRAACIYEQDGDGMAAVITLDGRAAALDYTDIWSDGGEAANLTACVLPSGWLLISATLRQRLPDIGGNPGECWVWGVAEDAAKKTISGGYLVPERMDGNNDTDVYAGAWSMAAVDDFTAVLTFPQALDLPVGFAVIDIDRTDGQGGGIDFRLISHGKYANSLPTLQTVGLSLGRWLTAYGVCWLSADKTVNKSGLAFEVWGLSRYAAELLWYGCDETRYRASMGNISAASAGPNAAAITYTGSAQGADGSYTDETKAVYMGLEGGPAPGAAVTLPQHSGFCRLAPISVTKAILLWSADGNGYAQYMALEERVMPVKDALVNPGYGLIDALALTGGESNATITIQTPGS